jgi:hypothetical protein
MIVAAVTAAFVAAATLGWAATFTLTTKKLGAAAVTTPVMFPDQITIANKGGGHLGKPENGDIFTFVFSRQVDEPTMCSGWTNTDPTPPSVKPQYSITKGVAAADDTFSVSGAAPAACVGGLHIGVVDLGANGYNTSATPIDFIGSTTVLTVGATTSTLVVTLNGQKNGVAGTVLGGGAATWTPDSAITDRSGHTCGANLSVTSSTTQL